jgi:hypothetical protein
LVPLLLAGCSAVPVVKVAEVLAHCDSYKGKIVREAGYLSDCGGYNCMLFADKAASDAFAAEWAEMQRIGRVRDEDGNPDRKAQDASWARLDAMWPIGVGFNEMVEPRMTAHGNRYVVITGRVEQDTCDGRGGTDRSPGIRPTDVRVWKRSEGAPADADDNAPFLPSTTLH